MSQDELSYPWKSYIGILVFGFLVFTMVDDIPDVGYSGQGTVVVENGECRPIVNGSICFNTWDVGGYDTDIATKVIGIGKPDIGVFEGIKYVYEREKGDKNWSGEAVYSFPRGGVSDSVIF